MSRTKAHSSHLEQLALMKSSAFSKGIFIWCSYTRRQRDREKESHHIIRTVESTKFWKKRKSDFRNAITRSIVVLAANVKVRCECEIQSGAPRQLRDSVASAHRPQLLRATNLDKTVIDHWPQHNHCDTATDFLKIREDKASFPRVTKFWFYFYYFVH